ncbi:hypothetical protein SAMN04487926_1552 [Paraburkholderia steynii]|uniref:Uncharacterized protein n=1 Tax=Paraburkholderia steynii TaxID=1245441 RepID=A0A7Z7BKZ9_9BURK|nr:hypothetical protein SAMN04487926_1552 [Paraburkholderia steynii]
MSAHATSQFYGMTCGLHGSRHQGVASWQTAVRAVFTGALCRREPE